VIRLEHFSGSLRGTSSTSDRQIIRIGRSKDCDVRFDTEKEPAVSNHHSEIVFEDGAYYMIDTGSTNGTLVNGRRIVKQKLKAGDRVRFGFPGGPEARVEIETGAQSSPTGAKGPTAFMSAPGEPAAVYDAEADAANIASALKAGAKDTTALKLADNAAQEVAQHRARVGGHSSGQTMFILANAIQQVSDVVRLKTKRHWVRVVLMVAGAGLVVAGGLGVVVYRQHRELDRLMAAKKAIDGQIVDIQKQMQAEQDPERLAELDKMLADLTGSAETTLAQLRQTDKKTGAEVAAGSDELDREIKRILAKFDAKTYAIPPIFRERLQYHIDQLKQSGRLQTVYNRKLKYWPAITKEFDALKLPEEMAYIAWAESNFDPEATSDAGARGMWQMTTTTAQSMGLRVDAQVDERLDVPRQTHAAARYLANLLSEFGEDSFMLAMASYNRGESGVRRVLHQVAQEPGGFKKEKRDFWHLYNTKKLPEETREYVPKVLAAAVVCNNPQQYGLETGGK
jgi:soluble lytic murein transglycosylase-like protein